MTDIQIFTCQRCEYRWASRLPDPRQCPGCSSRGWKTPHKISSSEPVGRLLPGQSCVLPWLCQADGARDESLNLLRRLAIETYARRHGWHLTTEGTPAGLFVFRI